LDVLLAIAEALLDLDAEGLSALQGDVTIRAHAAARFELNAQHAERRAH
jgi:hypothetical protein